MKTLTVEAEIAPDGSLHLEVPCGLPPGKAEVVLVIHLLSPGQPPYPSLEGSWQDLFPPDFDLAQGLQEIRHAWEREWEG